MSYKKLAKLILSPLAFLAIMVSSTAPITTSIFYTNQIKCPKELIH
ncbi:hypothetical protein GOQ27_16770 [Clostridium sp. D2Q-11]|uniref:Cyclic lactone autoinducer peptide n=1 Tax=Anaeromonas frigoriresistens TaxID=2683708 RepID=A0A942UVR1_9FIRM|nr:hypothetical protein [Anaeromonas frigoriresistens]MBS4540134.1 hypothetical protein [Anaeromonas frigoriresistens]